MFKSLTAQIVLAMFVGMACGLSFGPEAAPLGALGKLIIQMIKALAVPLVFVAILEAIISTSIPLNHVGRLFLIVSINGLVAITIALGLANIFRPGEGFAGVVANLDGVKFTPPKEKLEFITALSSYIPESIITPFANNTVISVVLMAVLFGLAARHAEAVTAIKPLPAVNFILKTLEQAIHWVIKLVPLAIFGVTAKTVGEHGFTPFLGLINYVALCIGGLLLHGLITYHGWILGVAKIPLNKFWHAALKPVMHAFGTNSSLATLPLTLKGLDELGVSKSSSRLGACVGTNLNNDGVLLYEVAAAIFLMQAFGQDIGISGQLNIALLSVLAAIGIAGIPEAGIISLSLVLTSVGLPLEALPLLLTVDWIIARCRSVINVMSDMTVSIVLNHWHMHKSTQG
jgi:DAACS family dicarboxylate/amino acid:cation (Na+ or H+) symporter